MFLIFNSNSDQGIKDQPETLYYMDKSKYIDLKQMGNAVQKVYYGGQSSTKQQQYQIEELSKEELASRTKSLSSSLLYWRPEGQILFEPVPTFAPQSDPVTCLCNSNVNCLIPRSFFLAGTKSGRIKLWDLRRYDKLGSTQARIEYDIIGCDAAVTWLQFCENSSFCFVAATANGLVLLLKQVVVVKYIL